MKPDTESAISGRIQQDTGHILHHSAVLSSLSGLFMPLPSQKQAAFWSLKDPWILFHIKPSFQRYQRQRKTQNPCELRFETDLEKNEIIFITKETLQLHNLVAALLVKTIRKQHGPFFLSGEEEPLLSPRLVRRRGAIWARVLRRR